MQGVSRQFIGHDKSQVNEADNHDDEDHVCDHVALPTIALRATCICHIESIRLEHDTGQAHEYCTEEQYKFGRVVIKEVNGLLSLYLPASAAPLCGKNTEFDFCRGDAGKSLILV